MHKVKCCCELFKNDKLRLKYRKSFYETDAAESHFILNMDVLFPV